MKLQGSLLFHLNLSYSSIEVGERGRIVERCYWPILELLHARPWLALCVEASGHTLERIDELDPTWTRALRALVTAGRVEFVGSGDTQLIGPLVPAEVNRWNQRLGVELYRRHLAIAPETALVNELAFSQGVVDAYLDAGYRTLLMEWNNPRSTHPEWSNELRYGPVVTASPAGRRIGLMWIDAIAFQKFQRAAVGDLEIERYCEWVRGIAEGDSPTPRHLFLYASDAEVFDFRPGRYTSEPALDEGGEWARVGAILDALHAEGLAFTTPASVRSDPAFAAGDELRLTSLADPIPVKKQPKYNVTRWALSGRDDVGRNRACFARARELARSGGAADEWRAVCRAWSSDDRTHLTEARWKALEGFAGDPVDGASPDAPTRAPDAQPALLRRAEVRECERRIAIATDGIELVLDLRRGLAIEGLAALPTEPLAALPIEPPAALPSEPLIALPSEPLELLTSETLGAQPIEGLAPLAPLASVRSAEPGAPRGAFGRASAERARTDERGARGAHPATVATALALAERAPEAATHAVRLLGTLPHGYFDDIQWAADFYSGHTVVEVPASMRVTDLERVFPRVDRQPRWIDVEASVATRLGSLAKRVRVKADRVELLYRLSRWKERPVGSLRTAFVTLDPAAFGGADVEIVCASGGEPERFAVRGPCDHAGAVSSLVSARAAFGATDGRLLVEGPRASLELAWDPGRAPALPLVSHREVDGRRMLRIAFSLSEIDDTHRPGAPLYDFELALIPRPARGGKGVGTR